MAVSFINHQTGDKFLIGGQASLTGADSSHAGTMPTYDITREEIRLADKTHLGFRYNITITGVATSGRNDVKTTKGEAQGVVMNLARQGLATLNSPNSKNYGVGKLEIAPYGGFENIISFNDARLISVEMAEQDEETSGTQYQNYTYSFEAYTNSSANVEQPEKEWLLKSASESWSLSETDNFTYDSMKIHEDEFKYKVYTLTHTVSAEGYRKYNNTGIDPDDGHAWRQAAKWVSNRLNVTESLGNIDEDLTGNTEELIASFNAKLMNTAGDTKLIDLFSDGYLPKNRTRTLQSDIAAGSYSVTETFTLVKGNINAFCSIESSIQSSVESEQPVTVSLTGRIIGLSDDDFGTKISDKYDNAKKEYNKVFNKLNGLEPAEKIKETILFDLANKAYSKVVGIAPGYTTGGLYDKIAIGFEETHDKAGGTIEFSATFSDAEEIIKDCYSCKVSVSYTNHGEKGQKPNPIAVIERGPYMYVPGTTDEKTATFTVEAKMRKLARGAKPDGDGAIDRYVKRDDRMKWIKHKPRVTSRSESWNPTTGVYTLALTYTYV